MTRTAPLLTLAALTLLAVPGQGQEANQQPSRRSVNDGVFTSEQADAGELAFMDWCSGCHDAEYFYGDEFTRNWIGRSVRSLFKQIVDTMPEDLPGGLSPEEYASVVAYILELNRYPVGSAPLPADQNELRPIIIDEKPGGSR